MYFVEYSRSQNCFHVDPMKELTNRNLYCFLLGQPVDYVPLGMFQTEREAKEICEALKPVRDRWVEKQKADCNHEVWWAVLSAQHVLSDGIYHEDEMPFSNFVKTADPQRREQVYRMLGDIIRSAAALRERIEEEEQTDCPDNEGSKE